MSAPPYYKQNRLKQLRAFCHAARLGSISRAAEQLFLSQPSVS
ncbi:MAG: LysR family transcriptional regulator, partial [Gammaproteobacteria bacterium]|nr:LysR family transcriptional regulator [Gammaproteobacteria bacterium]